MPRYYLHLHDGERLIEDLDGDMFPDLDSARLEALASARDLLAELVKAGKAIDGRRFDIVDDTGRVLMTIPLRDALVD